MDVEIDSTKPSSDLHTCAVGWWPPIHHIHTDSKQFKIPLCVGTYKGKTEEEPRAEVRRTFWKFEWDSKPPGEESWYLQSEEREKCPSIGSMLTVCGVKVPPKLLTGPSWQGGFVSRCKRQDRQQRDGNQPRSSRTLPRKVVFPARVCLEPLAISTSTSTLKPGESGVKLQKLQPSRETLAEKEGWGWGGAGLSFQTDSSIIDEGVAQTQELFPHWQNA